MGDPAKGARGAVKCARCGHPRAKHTTNPADGCTVIIWRTAKKGSGHRRQVRKDCECRYFVEGTS